MNKRKSCGPIHSCIEIFTYLFTYARACQCVCVCSCIDLQYVRMFEHSFFFRLREILHAAQVSVMDYEDIFKLCTLNVIFFFHSSLKAIDS